LIKHLSPSGFAGQYRGIVMILIVCLALFAATAIYIFISRRNKQPAWSK